MKITESVVAAVVTVSIAGGSYLALNPDKLTASAKAAADRASCRAVDAAILGYLTTHDRDPGSIADLQPYVKGDITAYRIVDGRAAGPGC